MPNRFLERLAYGSTFGYLLFFFTILNYAFHEVPLTYTKILMLFLLSVAGASVYAIGLPVVLRKFQKHSKASR